MIHRGVILAAGYGTRLLPVTRVVAKELLPLVDRPAIDLVIDEMVTAGIDEVLIIGSRRKKALEDWFDHDPELEGVFEREGAHAKLARVRPPGIRATFVRQARMGGTGDALRLARSFAGDQPVVVAFPDDIFLPADGATWTPDAGDNPSAALIATWRQTGGSVLGVLDLQTEDVSRYGVLDVVPGSTPPIVRGVVEKPAAGTEPSRLVSIGRFLYTPDFFDALDRHAAHHVSGEYFPMAAMTELAGLGRIAACPLTAARCDTGTVDGYVQAFVELALRRPDTAGPLRAWLDRRLGPLSQ